jgi:hypothetical protein
LARGPLAVFTAKICAAEVTVAEAQGDLATAEVAVLEAQTPIEMFDAEIVVIEAEESLAAKQGALIALVEAAAVLAL